MTHLEKVTDNRRRISLAGLFGVEPGARYMLVPYVDGSIKLVPVVSVPVSELKAEGVK